MGTHHVTRHADEGNGQVAERNAVLVPHGHAGEQVVDVEPVRVAGREGTDQRGGSLLLLPVLRELARQGPALPAAVHREFHCDAVYGLPSRGDAGDGEGDGEQVGGVGLLGGVGDELRGDAVGQHHAPVLAPEQAFQVICLVSHRIDAADQAADTRSAHEVDRHADLFDVLQRTHLGRAFRPAAGEHEAHRGAFLRRAHLVQPAADLPDRRGVAPRVDAVRGKAVGEVLRGHRKGGQQGEGYCECCPASIPQAARMSSPLEERMVHRIWWLFRRSRKASIAWSEAHLYGKSGI